ncbi:hypothetical protein TraAM80_00763 [Trypanosoma rangeli]|uniref:Flagellar attachment zone protein 1 conserved domain-containing protein n=1 Tax=Trypanosoma rangeli TaxID=5698 RepID=A0A3S5ISJ7_TRYRA|nr:uncharacterized protein TraAM80_00763 [Trypanosoma rangeli]RNF11680.1 hypothetical protein TraAM80_00763 [Trypanosoma rangeli]|eukprot:RNF11680.1 hypothetical protein TraAM80_00763 [Trypanosoma rangeli]
MTSPSKEEEVCRKVVGALTEVLAISDLQAVAQGMLHPIQSSASTKLASLEETLLQNSRLAREHAAILRDKLRAGFPSPSASGVTGCDPSVLPKIIDLSMFVEKSRLLQERIQRVFSTFGSLRNVRLLSEASTGRYLLTERASVAATELLGVLLSLGATIEGAPLQIEAERNTARSRYVVLNPHWSSRPLDMGAKKFVHAATSMVVVDEVHRDTPSKLTSIVKRQHNGETDDTQQDVEGTPLHLAGGKNNEVEDQKNDEESTIANRCCEQKQALLLQEEKEGSNTIENLQKSSINNALSSTSCHSATFSSRHVGTTVQSSLLKRCNETRASSMSRKFKEVAAKHADSLESMALAHHVSLEELCIINAHLLAYKHKPLPFNTTVRIPTGKGDSNALVPTCVVAHSRIFQGELWRELLRKEDAVSPPRWKDLFIQEVGALFGIPHQWVSDVQLVNDRLTLLTGGDQEVAFKVRLPLSLEEDEVRKRIQQHEFMSMLLLYEELQKEKEECEEEEARKIVENGANSSTSLASLDSSGSRSLSDSADTAAPNSDTDSGGNRGGITDVDSLPSCSNNGILREAITALMVTETLSRDSLVIQERYGRKIAMRALPQGQPLPLEQRHGAAKPSHAESQLHRKQIEENKPPCEASDVSGKDVPCKHLDAGLPCELPPLSPRTATLPRSDPISAATPERRKTGVSSLVWSTTTPSPVRTGGEICAAEHQDGDTFRNFNFLPNPKLTDNLEPGTALGPKKTLEATVQWFHTSHEKCISGERWDIVLAKEEEQLRCTFTLELAALFDLPEENVQALKFELGSLHATFELMHDRYLEESAINALLSVFDFPKVRSLYHRCIEAIDASPSRNGDSVTGDGSELGSIGSPDVRCQASSTGGVTGIITRCILNERTGGTVRGIAGEKCLISTALLKHPLCSSNSLSLENSATPDNEPDTLAHLALVHDLPIEAIQRANPHLATLGANDVLPFSTEVVIPRSASDDDACSFKEDAVERNVRGTAPSLESQAPQGISITRAEDIAGLQLPMGEKSAERNLGVGAQALGQRNSPSESCGGTVPLLRSSPTNVSVQSIAAADSLGVASSARGSKRSPAMPRVVRDLRPTTGTGSGNAMGKKGVGLGLEGPSQEQPAWKTVMKKKQVPAVGAEKREFSPQSQESVPLTRVITERSLGRPQNHTPYLSDSFQFIMTQLSSTMKNAAARSANAVLMLQPVERFVLLHFFAKWQHIAQIRKAPHAPLAVQGVPVNGSQAKNLNGRKPLNLLFQRKNPDGVLTSKRALSPKTEAERGNKAGFIVKTMEAIARTANGSALARETKHVISPGVAVTSSLQQYTKEGVSGTRKPYVPGLTMIAEGNQIQQLPLHSSSDNELKPSPTHGVECGTPRLSFGVMGSDQSRSCGSSPDMEVNGASDFAMTERFSLGIYFSSFLTVIEVHGEAAAAGIERGDQLQEIEGIQVRKLKDLRRVLASVGGTHFCMRFQKKGSMSSTEVRLRRSWRGVIGSEASSSRSTSPSEPRIAPMFEGARSGSHGLRYASGAR